GEGDCLNHRKALARAILEVTSRLLAIQPVKELPGRVAQIKERPAVVILQVAFGRPHLQPRSCLSEWRSCDDERRKKHERNTNGSMAHRFTDPQWISGSLMAAVPSRKSKSQPRFACVTCRAYMWPKPRG